MMKILVVDDEPDVEPLLLQGLRRRIRSGDLVLAFAGDGEAALERLAQESGFDIVLTDINMPRMDGLSLLGRLQGRFDLRTVIISAYGDMNNIRNAMNRGAFDFITKPINLVDLEATLDKTARDLEAMRDMRRQRDAAVRARSNLSRYFSPNIVELLSARDKPLAPMRQEVVALFADLVGFTSYAENLEPEVVMDLLREFHSRMSEQVFAFDGTLQEKCPSFGVRGGRHCIRLGRNAEIQGQALIHVKNSFIFVWLRRRRQQKRYHAIRRYLRCHVGSGVEETAEVAALA